MASEIPSSIFHVPSVAIQVPPFNIHIPPRKSNVGTGAFSTARFNFNELPHSPSPDKTAAEGSPFPWTQPSLPLPARPRSGSNRALPRLVAPLPFHVPSSNLPKEAFTFEVQSGTFKIGNRNIDGHLTLFQGAFRQWKPPPCTPTVFQSCRSCRPPLGRRAHEGRHEGSRAQKTAKSAAPGRHGAAVRQKSTAKPPPRMKHSAPTNRRHMPWSADATAPPRPGQSAGAAKARPRMTGGRKYFEKILAFRNGAHIRQGSFTRGSDCSAPR